MITAQGLLQTAVYSAALEGSTQVSWPAQAEHGFWHRPSALITGRHEALIAASSAGLDRAMCVQERWRAAHLIVGRQQPVLQRGDGKDAVLHDLVAPSQHHVKGPLPMLLLHVRPQGQGLQGRPADSRFGGHGRAAGAKAAVAAALQMGHGRPAAGQKQQSQQRCWRTGTAGSLGNSSSRSSTARGTGTAGSLGTRTSSSCSEKAQAQTMQAERQGSLHGSQQQHSETGTVQGYWHAATEGQEGEV